MAGTKTNNAEPKKPKAGPSAPPKDISPPLQAEKTASTLGDAVCASSASSDDGGPSGTTLPRGINPPRSGKKTSVSTSIAELARQYGSLAVDTLVAVAQGNGTDSARVSAANSLLDRGFGKISQHLEVTARPDLIQAIEQGRKRAGKPLPRSGNKNGGLRPPSPLAGD